MRDLHTFPDTEQLFRFSVKQLLTLGREAIEARDFFYLALSGGSTPKNIFHLLASPEFRQQIDWSRVLLFWSDERCVPPTDTESNYRMAMDSGFDTIPILPEHIFRMHGEADPEYAGEAYDQLIRKIVPEERFDLVMLGMGSDGHTASLFPDTKALTVQEKLATANYIPEKKCFRLTLTFPCINRARHVTIYVTGEEKAKTVSQVFAGAKLPIAQIQNPTWILDAAAAKELQLS